MDETTLDAASAAGRLDVVKSLLETSQLNRKSLLSSVVKTRYPCFNPTALSKAAENGHVDIVKELVSFYDEATNFECGCPLHVACLNGHAACVRIIATDLPQLVNEEDEDGLSPIHIAAKTGYVEVTKILLQAGADVNKIAEIRYLMHRDYGRYTALYLASSKGHTDVVKVLLANGADPLVEAERDECCLDILSCMTRLCPLSVAAYSGHFDTLKVLSKVVPLDQRYGSRAVVVADVKEQNTCLQYLLEMGAPTFSHLKMRQQLDIWIKLVSCRSNAEPEQQINAVRLLLHHGMTLKLLVSAHGRAMSDFLADLELSTLRFLLNCGFFELRYHKYHDHDELMLLRNMSRINEEHKLLYHDFHHIVGCFRRKSLITSMMTVFAHFPRSISDLSQLASDIGCQNIYNKVFCNASPLLHLCRWKIRSNLLVEHDFISQDLVAKLRLPPSLQRYLLFQ